MIIPVNNFGGLGLVPDLPASEQPLNVWTSGQNVRFQNGVVKKMTGHSEVYPTPLNAPYWLFYVPGLWLYAGLTAVGATDTGSHADITRVAGAYNANNVDTWTGGSIEDIVVLTNGTDVPQMWNPPALATKLIALSGFPANTTCKVLRSFKRYLVALDVTKVATRYKQMIKWSDQAPTGLVPASWDETDETIDAGEYTLPSEGGDLQDLILIRDSGALYKTNQVWRMEYVGGVDIFDFRKVFGTFGAVSRRCAAEFFTGEQIVYTGDDLVLHDLTSAKSVLDNKAKALFRGLVDQSLFGMAWVAVNYYSREVWVGIVEIGYLSPNKAVVWNWNLNTVGVRELPGVAFAEAGPVIPFSDTWDGSAGTWDADTGTWNDGVSNPNERRLMLASSTNTKLYLADSTEQFDGSSLTANVVRTGLGFPLKVNAPPDFTTEKLLKGIWPHITGTAGGVVNVYVGTQSTIEGDVTWGAAFPFTIGTSSFLDPLVSSRLFALKFESTGNITWSMSGYDVEVVAIGGR